MIKGITAKEEKIIKDILEKYPYEFYYYGSRVKGDYTPKSDLDILIKSENELSSKELENLKLQFNLCAIPYVVNFAEYNKMNKDFYKLIENSLISIF